MTRRLEIRGECGAPLITTLDCPWSLGNLIYLGFGPYVGSLHIAEEDLRGAQFINLLFTSLSFYKCQLTEGYLHRNYAGELMPSPTRFRLSDVHPFFDFPLGRMIFYAPRAMGFTNPGGISVHVCDVSKSSFAESTVKTVEFIESTAQQVDFSCTRFARCRFSRTDITGSNFTRSRLGCLVLDGGKGEDLCFDEAAIGIGCEYWDEPGSGCHNISLARSRFVRAKIRNFSFSGLDLTQADFTQASLRNVNFSMTKLAGVSFDGATLRGVDFSGTNLLGTSFKSATWREIKYDSKTCWPEDYDLRRPA